MLLRMLLTCNSSTQVSICPVHLVSRTWQCWASSKAPESVHRRAGEDMLHNMLQRFKPFTYHDLADVSSG
jgi:hypothetical protein